MESLLKFFLLILTLAIYVTLSAHVDDYKSYKNYKVFGINNDINLEKLIGNMEQLDESLVYSQNKEMTQILIAPHLVSTFEKMAAENKLKVILLVDDYHGQVLEGERCYLDRRTEFSWKAYYDVENIHYYLRNMSRVYPQWAEVIEAGKSYEGRPILGLRVNTPTKKNAESYKPTMFIESGIHAREWITPATTTYFINQLLTSHDPDIVSMRDGFDWHIFPTVNPDGYHFSFTRDRMWRKTRSKSPNGCYGADPNRNWDYNWLKHGASNNPCNYQTYGGSEPFSEIETRSLSEYVSNLDYLTGYIAFHADAQMLLLPYSDSVEHNDNYDDLVQIGNTSLAYGYKVNGEEYRGPATAAEILYKASGGSMDWVRHALGTPLVYTYELRGIYFHWPGYRIPEQGDEVTQMMLGLVREAENLGYF